MKLYAYWEGDSRHWYYDACWATVLHHNPGAVLLTTADVEDVIGPLPEVIKAAYVTHRCDWIRKKFIHAVGGAWVDMDFVCCESLDFMVAQSEIFDYVGYKEWNKGWMDNFFAGRKGSIILEAAAEHAYANIAQCGLDIPWLAASTDSLNHAFSKYPWVIFCQLPTHIVTPFDIAESDNFLRHLDADNEIDHNALGFMTSLHILTGYWNRKDEFESLGIKSAEALIDSATPLGAMFRRAFGKEPRMSTPAVEISKIIR
jgi:hypothetical protein